MTDREQPSAPPEDVGDGDDARQANQFLDAIIENIPHMVFVKDAETLSFARFNRAGEELLGMSRHELLGKNDFDFFPKDEAVAFQAKDRETLRGKTVVDVAEEPIETKGGRRWLHTKKVPLLAKDGTPSYLLGISEDITEQRREAETRLRLASIVESSNDAILSETLDGIVVSWNRAAEATFGYTADEMIGRPAARLVPDDRPEERQRLVELVRRGARVESFETVRRRRDAREFDASVTVSPVRDVAGAVIGMSTIARDVTELKDIRRALERERNAAQAANRELESFSYSVAHDLRAPLRSIDGFSQVLLEDYHDRLDDDGKRYLSFVRTAAQRMGQLIDDLLTLSRVTRSELHRESVDLGATARAVVERLREASPGRRVDVVIAPDVRAHGDPRLLAVVIENLLGNAWKFTGKRAQARIELGVSTGAGPPTYFVRDDGAGFDPAFAGKLFGAFQRLHAERDFEGTGVGLATVQRIVARHGGRVWAEGQVDVGATFYFTLEDAEREERKP
jgi:PAS domain S-box-containing protein